MTYRFIVETKQDGRSGDLPFVQDMGKGASTRIVSITKMGTNVFVVKQDVKDGPE
ncbi:hypothetical protein ACEUZ9_004082 [Paracoccus litorisediminis]|uniref:hypothetical protein n=1 Tax=Paracoccus litorisediminis TaxID=2006130 RepID=UPI003734A4AC